MSAPGTQTAATASSVLWIYLTVEDVLAGRDEFVLVKDPELVLWRTQADPDVCMLTLKSACDDLNVTGWSTLDLLRACWFTACSRGMDAQDELIENLSCGRDFVPPPDYPETTEPEKPSDEVIQ